MKLLLKPRLMGNPYVLSARALAASRIFRLPLGKRSLGEHLANFLSPLQDRWLIKALSTRIPLLLLYRLALQSYEPETTRLFRRLLRPGMTVVDVGAGFGDYTVIAAMEVGKEGHVYAFEPDPRVLRILRRNVRFSGYEDLITIVPMAVTSGPGQAELFFREETAATNIFPPRSPVEGKSIMTETISLDAYFAKLGWPRVDLMVIDVEGAEALVLMGMAELIPRNPHIKLIVEFHPWLIDYSGWTGVGFLEALGRFGFARVWAISHELQLVQGPQDLPWLIETASRQGYLNLLCERG